MRCLRVFFLTTVLLLAGTFVCDAAQGISPKPDSTLASLQQASADALLLHQQDSAVLTQRGAVSQNSVIGATPTTDPNASGAVEAHAGRRDIAIANSECGSGQLLSYLSGQRQDRKSSHVFLASPGPGSGLSANTLVAVIFATGCSNDTHRSERGAPGGKPDDPRADPRLPVRGAA